jgi:hypothetical protein
MPESSETTTSLVIIAIMMIKSGMSTERNPKFSMVCPLNNISLGL